MLNVRYGGGFVRFNHSDAAQVSTLQTNPAAPIADYKGLLALSAVRAIGSLPLHMLLRPFDCVTLLLYPDELARTDGTLPAIISYLGELGIHHSNLTILIADRASDLAPAARHVMPGYYGDIRLVIHNPDAPDLMTLGTTEHGTPVRVNPLLAGRNRVIAISPVRTDPLLGFTGGPEILLGACGRDTLEGCLRFALGTGQPLLQSFETGAPINPLSQELRAVARLIQPLFSVNLVCDGHGVQTQMLCGRWEEAWNFSCVEALRVGALPLAQRAQIVLASAGGAPWDASFQGSVRGLLGAAGALAPGGTLLFTAECKELEMGLFAECLEAHQQGVFQQRLSEHPTFARIYFAALQQVIAGYQVLVQSKINTQVIAQLGVRGFRTSETMEAALEWQGKQVCYLPDSLLTIAVPARS